MRKTHSFNLYCSGDVGDNGYYFKTVVKYRKRLSTFAYVAKRNRWQSLCPSILELSANRKTLLQVLVLE